MKIYGKKLYSQTLCMCPGTGLKGMHIPHVWAHTLIQFSHPQVTGQSKLSGFKCALKWNSLLSNYYSTFFMKGIFLFVVVEQSHLALFSEVYLSVIFNSHTHGNLLLLFPNRIGWFVCETTCYFTFDRSSRNTEHLKCPWSLFLMKKKKIP